MSWAQLRRWRFAPFLALLAIGDGPTPGQVMSYPGAPPTSLFDPRMGILRRASATWEAREGPERAVIDQVCLVPDFPTFLEAISTWDRGHAFPILFDDVESSSRFLRAFRPSRVVRYPKAAGPVPREALWGRALAAVASSWSPGGSGPKLAGDAVPRSLGSTPPGVVVCSPDAPMLAGAVALAAGRFQPLIRLDRPQRFAEILSPDQFEEFDASLTRAILDKVPLSRNLGDDCDFVTIAGDWPFRYRDRKGEVNAVDDGVARSSPGAGRWAYAGRLMGGARESVYRAMCSLFLQPDSALMFNGYDEDKPPWSGYSMRTAALRLSGVLPTSHVSGDRQAGIDGWHETFDPLNRFGLILINSHGSPQVFNIRGGPAGAADIPLGVPSVVLMIHSFSAADPADPSTVAGRWLANGAFAFFGSVNEPYLQAFRNPQLVGDLIGEKLPIVAAVRTLPPEPYGTPWRLIFLGDPLYRLESKYRRKSRVTSWEPTAHWPSLVDSPRPVGEDDAALLNWAVEAAFARLAAGKADGPGDDLVEAVREIRRDRLPASRRPVLDALMVEVLLGARRRGTLRSWINSIPGPERSPALRRCSETLQAIELSFAMARDDAPKAWDAWSEVIRSDIPGELKEQATARVGKLARSPGLRREWAGRLRLILRERANGPEARSIAAELKRVEEAQPGR